ncbi:alpha/beta fold hydrolase [Elioraea sp.]|uniref:alpha/beta fold hydrolase n=1 Tax=Elioraea sp. TaxID=2185103 RepID=UPI0025C51104|nr:alpha/beta fold hydrolase [Elioraea sp.]
MAAATDAGLAPAPIPSDLAALGAAPAAIIAAIEAQSTRMLTPCGEGDLVWRAWGAGPPLVLFHGGYGSWTHWIRTILPFAARHRVIAVDLPGLGESAHAPEPHTAEGLASILLAGLDRILFPGETVDLVGFSFGGVLGGHVAAGLGDRLGHFVAVGAGGLGLPRADMEPLRSWRAAEPGEARLAVHRDNLAILMFADPRRIDPLALYLQQRNAENGRVKSPVISRTDTLRQALPRIRGRLSGIWGGEDNVARGNIAVRGEVLRAAQADAAFAVIPGAGHWVAYEAAEEFNATLASLLDAAPHGAARPS